MKEFKPQDILLAMSILKQRALSYDEGSITVKETGLKDGDQPCHFIAIEYTDQGENKNYHADYFPVQISDVLAAKEVGHLVVRTHDRDRDGLIKILREELGINIVEACVVSNEIGHGTYDVLVMDHAIAPESLLYQGAVGITYLPEFPGQEGPILVSVPGKEIQTKQLDLATRTNAPLAGAEIRNNGQLTRKGAGPNGGFTTSTDGELSLSLTARYRGVDVLPETTLDPEEPIHRGHYDLVRQKDSQWMSVFSIVTQSGVPVTDLYDVFLLAGVAGGEGDAIWKLTQNGNRLELVGAGGQITEISGTPSVCQGIIDPKNLLTSLGVVSEEGNDLYSVQLLAYLKDTIVMPFKTSITVSLKPEEVVVTE